MQDFDYSESGARKVALLLSILDSRTACALLDLFDDDVANRIVEKARTIKTERISPEEIEPIVKEFVQSFGGDSKLTRALLAEAKRTLDSGAVKRNDSHGLSKYNPETAVLAERLDRKQFVLKLQNERPTTILAILSSMPIQLRKEIELLLPNETRECVSRLKTEPFKSNSALFHRTDYTLDLLYDFFLKFATSHE